MLRLDDSFVFEFVPSLIGDGKKDILIYRVDLRPSGYELRSQTSNNGVHVAQLAKMRGKI